MTNVADINLETHDNIMITNLTFACKTRDMVEFVLQANSFLLAFLLTSLTSHFS